ncbi:hypothetical protein [Streptantibioticus ferralitis]|uniref:Uncharacterized protein n=1 Tax=Streptantibioticus ferralitis TaxID=236510 RepID=A0ABT5Z0E0_9ACTN|nr:hypothetical protein [Streptantibioticus ferralitis]MDF2257302.1 hypothetical protein [Streptantibioticus ferralitis]
MSLVLSADVFKSIELQVSQLFRRQLICPHRPGQWCSVSEHLTLSEAKEVAAREAADGVLHAALWWRVGRDAHSDAPNLARRTQLLAVDFVGPYLRKSAAKVSRTLCVDVADVRSAMVFGALYGLALTDDGDDVRNKIMRTAHDAGWAVERANPVERTTDPHSLVDRRGGCDDYTPVRDESDVHAVDEVDASLRDRISGERWGATLHRLGILEDFLTKGSGQMPESESGLSHTQQEDAE